MALLSPEDIRRRFESSQDFNEIFEAFQHAILQRLDNIELYRKLFWNNSLSSDELCLFGEKLAIEFPQLSYDVFMWLASVFEVTYGHSDNCELALRYYKKAASIRPTEVDPYLDAADCYDPDINVPPLVRLIDFLKKGSYAVNVPKPLYQRLAHFYDLAGNDEMHSYYLYQLRKLDENPPLPPPGIPPSFPPTPPNLGSPPPRPSSPLPPSPLPPPL